MTKPLHAWACLNCEEGGLTTVTASDVSGEARKHVDTTQHSIRFDAMPSKAAAK